MYSPYPFNLYVHCGVRDAIFDGRLWVAVPGTEDGNSNPPPGWGNPVDKGAMELVTEDRARYSSQSGGVVEFEPLTGGEDSRVQCD